MEEIVSSVKRVADIMSEITAASQEQSSGIEQINQAVTQMDEITQQNAAGRGSRRCRAKPAGSGYRPVARRQHLPHQRSDAARNRNAGKTTGAGATASGQNHCICTESGSTCGSGSETDCATGTGKETRVG
jgi:hypothetical protein